MLRLARCFVIMLAVVVAPSRLTASPIEIGLEGIHELDAITSQFPGRLFLRDAARTSLGTVSSLFVNDDRLSGDPGSAPDGFLQLAVGRVPPLTFGGDPAGGSLGLDDFAYTLGARAELEPATVTFVVVGGLVVFRSLHRQRSRRSRAAMKSGDE